MTDKLKFIGQANFTWMEIVRLRKYCNLHLKIHYVKDFFVTFFLFFFRERKRKETNQRKQKERPWEILNGWLSKDGTECRANISTKMLAHASHFRGVSSVILKFKTKNALAGAFSAVTCSKNSLVLFERIFCVPLRPTTVFLSSFWSVFLLSFSKEGRKMRKKYV